MTTDTSTNITLKITKKMAALLAALLSDSGTVAKIKAEVDAGRADKDGAVTVEVERENGLVLLGLAKGRMSLLDTVLPMSEAAEKHKLMGEHSAWRALVKQLPEFTPAA